MITEPEEEEEPQGPIIVNTFHWLFSPSEIEYVETERGVDHYAVIDIKKIGRKSRRFLPRNVKGAKGYFYLSEDAKRLRERKGILYIAKVICKPWDPEPDPETGEIPPMPEDFLETPVIEDLSEEFPDDVPQGRYGWVVKAPLNFRAKIMIAPHETVSNDKKHFSKLRMHMSSPDDIRKLGAICEVKDNNILTYTRERTPVINGPLDGRMGASERGGNCLTCKLPLMSAFGPTCTGHFGYIELPEPVPHVLFAIGEHLTKCINMFCHHCGEIPITQEREDELLSKVERIFSHNANRRGLMRIRQMTTDALRKNKVVIKERSMRACRKCGEESPKIEWKLQERKFMYTPYVKKVPSWMAAHNARFASYSSIYQLFMSVSDTAARLMGFDAPLMRPEYMFLRALPVAPNTMRPLKQDVFGNKLENALTVLYSKVVVRCNDIRRSKASNADPGLVQKKAEDLFIRVAHCFWNQDPTIGAGDVATITSGGKSAPVKGVLDYIRGIVARREKSQFRRMLNSKITNNLVRSVINPNGDLSINEVGVPKGACLTTFLEETVTEENRERLLELVIKGYPRVSEHEGLLYDQRLINRRYPTAMAVRKYGLKDNEMALNDRLWWDERVASGGGDVLPPVQGWTDLHEEWLEHKETLPIEEWEKWEDPHGIKDTAELVAHKLAIAKELFSDQWNQERRRTYWEDQLTIGDVVLRNPMEGDYALFTRAPALHRQSMLGLRIIPLDQQTLSFNPAICAPFNADFDGDQMNLFVMTSEQAQEELRGRLQLRDNIIHNRMGKLAIGTDHDQTSGVYLLSMKDKARKGTFDTNTGVGFTEEGLVYFTKSRFCQLIAAVYYKDEEGELHVITDIGEPDYKKQFYTGYRALSLVIPDGINARFKSGLLYNDDGTIMMDEDGSEVKDETIILNGELIKGTLDRTFMGKEKGSLAPAFFYRFGYEEGFKQLQKFIDMLCRLGFSAHHHVGYTMGLTDCGLQPKRWVTINEDYEVISEERLDYYDAIRSGYEEVSLICIKIEKAFQNHDMEKYLVDDAWMPDWTEKEKRLLFERSPYAFRQALILQAQEPWDSSIINTVSNISGNHNAMEIAVRSGARGKPGFIQQMGGAYGQTLISGSIPMRGFESRMFSHYPLSGKPLEHPMHRGFVKNCFYTGLEPNEYFTVSMAGRRADMESSTGELQKSGHLANVMRRSMESLVVDGDRRVIDLADGRLVSYVAGDDGYRPHASRMTHRFPDGQVRDTQGTINASDEDQTLELQPFFFDHPCKHGVPLEMSCDDCTKGSPFVEYFDETFSSIVDNRRLIDAVKERLNNREVGKVTVNKMIAALTNWHLENLVSVGEAIGSTGAGCIAEPATQASLRTFHAGGKGSGTSVQRLEAILRATDATTPEQGVYTYVRLREQYWSREEAERIAHWCTPYHMGDIIDVIDYDTGQGRLHITLSPKKMEEKNIDQAFLLRQFKRSTKGWGEIIEELTGDYQITIEALGKTAREMLNLKEFITLIIVSGVQYAGAAFAIPAEDGSWSLMIGGAAIGLWKNIESLLPDYVELESLWCDNPKTVEDRLGIEAALLCAEYQLNQQMNGSDGGIGEYDWRFVRTIIDSMGKEGTIIGHGPDGQGGRDSPNALDAMALEDMIRNLRNAVIIGNESDLKSPTSSTIVGRPPLVGEELVRHS